MLIGQAETITDDVNVSMTDKPWWLGARQGGVGGSDISKLLAAYRNPDDPKPDETWLAVYQSKVDPVDDADRPALANLPAARGLALEPFAAQLYEEMTGLATVSVPMARHPVDHWRLANVDRMVLGPDGEFIRGLEIKCPSAHNRVWFGKDLPLYVRLQCLWYMDITGFDRWDVLALVDCEPKYWTVERDEPLIERMNDTALEFWTRHVLPEIPPTDDPYAVADWIQTYNPPQPGSMRGPTVDEDDLGERILRCRARAKALEQREKYLKGQLALGIAEDGTEKLLADTFTLASTEKKGSTSWQATAKELAIELSLARDGALTSVELLDRAAKHNTKDATRSLTFRAR